MKNISKIIVTAAICLATPSLALASWWNPATWFGNSASTNIQATTTVAVASSTSTSTVKVVSSVKTVQATSTSVSSTSLQSQISSLTSENNSLKSQLASVQSQLKNAQADENICENNTAPAPVVSTQSSSTAVSAATPTASAKLLLDGATPMAHSVNTSTGQYINLPILAFDIDTNSLNSFSIHSLAVNILSSGQGGVGAAYLYQGSYPTPIATALIVNGTATFNAAQISSAAIMTNDSGDNFTIAVDVSGITDSGDRESVSASAVKLSLADKNGNIINATGTAFGNVISVNEQ